MGGGQYRTNSFAWCIIALLTHHGLECHFDAFACGDRIVLLFFGYTGIVAVFGEGVIAVDTHPVHLTATNYFVFTYYRNVIFNLTAYHASSATGTCVQINGQPSGDLRSHVSAKG